MRRLSELREGNYVQIARNPFARMSLLRRCIPRQAGRPKCAWCGLTARFVYRNEMDDSGMRHTRDSKPFCSIVCFRISETP